VTVYVDALRDWGWKLRGQPQLSCHMLADTEAELHDMAYAIGMKRTWFQAPPKVSFPHYDLVASRRARAVQLGAVEVDRGELREVLKRLRATTAGEVADG
jgi:hypothetical protein